MYSSVGEDGQRRKNVPLILLMIGVGLLIVTVAVVLPVTLNREGPDAAARAAREETSQESKKAFKDFKVRWPLAKKRFEKKMMLAMWADFKAERKAAYAFKIEGETYILPTVSMTKEGESYSWLGSFVKPNFEQVSASFSCTGPEVMGAVHLPGEYSWEVTNPGGELKLEKMRRASPQFSNPDRGVGEPPAVGPAELEVDVEEEEDQVPRSSQEGNTGRKLMATTGGGNVNEPLRVLVWFDEARCGNQEHNAFNTLRNFLQLHWSSNMKITNWEVMYTCVQVTDKDKDMLSFPNAFRSEGVKLLRQFYGADLLIAVGNYSAPLHEGGGDHGPYPLAVTNLHWRGVAMEHVLTHELGHNFGLRHDRYNAFNTRGAYECQTHTANCNYGFQNQTFLSMMAYGTEKGCTGSHVNRHAPRIYVYSGFNVPGTTRMVGNPPGGSVSGQPCAYNKATLERYWPLVRSFYSSSSCPQFQCPDPVPAQGCQCVKNGRIVTPPSVSRTVLRQRVVMRYAPGTQFRVKETSGGSSLASQIGDVVEVTSGGLHSPHWVFVINKRTSRKGFIQRGFIEPVNLPPPVTFSN